MMVARRKSIWKAVGKGCKRQGQEKYDKPKANEAVTSYAAAKLPTKKPRKKKDGKKSRPKDKEEKK
eukprot:422828-Amphidinium_carterae.1